MLLWTVLVIWRFSEHTRRTPLWLGLDLAVALAALISTPFVKTEWFNASIPGFWIAGALLAWAVHWRMLGGLVAATLLCATDLLLRQEISQTNRSEEHTSELQSLMRISYAVFCLKKKKNKKISKQHA